MAWKPTSLEVYIFLYLSHISVFYVRHWNSISIQLMIYSTKNFPIFSFLRHMNEFANKFVWKRKFRRLMKFYLIRTHC